jgi:hypothetical protein
MVDGSPIFRISTTTNKLCTGPPHKTTGIDTGFGEQRKENIMRNNSWQTVQERLRLEKLEKQAVKRHQQKLRERTAIVQDGDMVRVGSDGSYTLIAGGGRAMLGKPDIRANAFDNQPGVGKVYGITHDTSRKPQPSDDEVRAITRKAIGDVAKPYSDDQLSEQEIQQMVAAYTDTLESDDMTADEVAACVKAFEDDLRENGRPAAKRFRSGAVLHDADLSRARQQHFEARCQFLSDAWKGTPAAPSTSTIAPVAPLRSVSDARAQREQAHRERAAFLESQWRS